MKEMHRPSAIGIVNCLCLPVLCSRQADLATHVEWIVLHTNILVPFFLVVFFRVSRHDENISSPSLVSPPSVVFYREKANLPNELSFG